MQPLPCAHLFGVARVFDLHVCFLAFERLALGTPPGREPGHGCDVDSMPTYSSSSQRSLSFVMVVLCILPLALVVYKCAALGYRLEDILPVSQYRVSVQMSLDGHDEQVRLRTFIPSSDDHQQISEEEQEAGGNLRFTSEHTGENRVATWTGASVANQTRLHYAFSVLSTAAAYGLSPELNVPDAYPRELEPYLRPSDAIQVDHEEVRAALARIGADRGPVVERLRAIFDFAAGLSPRPFKGTTDALTALRLGEASCNGKSRVFVALARAAGLPARLVGGLILDEGEKRTSHQWVEVYVGGYWVPFCPTNGHFAELPAHYLVLYKGDEALFRHTSDVNFDYGIHITRRSVPAPRVKEALGAFNVWALFERLHLPFSLLRTVLMLPVGALVVVLFRNVVGIPTFGTFLPALIAAAAGETGLFWGLVSFLLVTAAVVATRTWLQRLGLLHSPTLAILLAVVVLVMLSTSLVAAHFGNESLARVSYFPIAVMAIVAERTYLALADSGLTQALVTLAGTLLVILGCYLVMNSLALQVLVSGFPELLLWVVAANLFLGRWVGVRLLELWRFRRLLSERQPA